MLQVGVTGGVGSGKSTVAGMLAERGAVVIHADAIVAETRQPGGPAYADIVDRFGTAVVARDGTLDRRALAEIGNDEAARARIAAQISRDERLAVADIVIDNSGSIEELAAQVEPLWAWLGELRTTLR